MRSSSCPSCLLFFSHRPSSLFQFFMLLASSFFIAQRWWVPFLLQNLLLVQARHVEFIIKNKRTYGWHRPLDEQTYIGVRWPKPDWQHKRTYGWHRPLDGHTLVYVDQSQTDSKIAESTRKYDFAFRILCCLQIFGCLVTPRSRKDQGLAQKRRMG